MGGGAGGAIKEVFSLYFDLILETVCSTDWLRRGIGRLYGSIVRDAYPGLPKLRDF